MIERKTNYIWNEFNSIVVKYKHFSISGRSPTQLGNEENYIILLVHHILKRALTELANTLKNVLEQKFL